MNSPGRRAAHPRPPPVDWVEAISENFMAPGGRPVAVLEEVRRARRPVRARSLAAAVHGGGPSARRRAPRARPGGAGATDPPRERLVLRRVPGLGYLWRLTDALREDYPKIAALLGDERFLALAEAYAREHPSDRPDLGQFGRHLPAFLRRFPAPERRDLADLAALEWARAEVFLEAPAMPVARAALAATGPAAFLHTRLELIPALRVLALGHDVGTAWRRLEDGDPVNAPIATSTAVVVWREGFEVFHGRIELDEAKALDAARAGEPLASVCAEFGQRENPAEAAFVALTSWFDQGWIAAISA